MRGGVGQRADDLQLLEHRARPSVRDDQRHRIGVARTHVDEVDVEPVDSGHELRVGIELGFRPAPVVVRAPVVHKFLERVQLHALGSIGDGLAVRPTRGGNALTQLGYGRLRKVGLKRTDGLVFDDGTLRWCLGVRGNHRLGMARKGEWD
jgi:hypothetical protein